MYLIKNFGRTFPLPISRGFTIIELMMALVIMAILASTAVPIYRDYSVRAKVAEAYGVVSALKLSVEDDYISSGNRFRSTDPCDSFSLECTESIGTPVTTKFVKTTYIGPEGVIEITLDETIITELDERASGGDMGNVIRFVPMTRIPIKSDGAVTDYNPASAGTSGVIAWKCVSGGFTVNVYDENGDSVVADMGTSGVNAKFAPGECKK